MDWVRESEPCPAGHPLWNPAVMRQDTPCFPTPPKPVWKRQRPRVQCSQPWHLPSLKVLLMVGLRADCSLSDQIDFSSRLLAQVPKMPHVYVTIVKNVFMLNKKLKNGGFVFPLHRNQNFSSRPGGIPLAGSERNREFHTTCPPPFSFPRSPLVSGDFLTFTSPRAPLFTLQCDSPRSS